LTANKPIHDRRDVADGGPDVVIDEGLFVGTGDGSQIAFACSGPVIG